MGYRENRQSIRVSLHPKIARALKAKAAITDKSVSDLINDALTEKLLQDAEDLRAVRKRKGEKGRNFEDVLKDL